MKHIDWILNMAWLAACSCAVLMTVVMIGVLIRGGQI